MKAFTVVAALCLGLLTVPAFAQTTQQKPPAKPPVTQTPPAPAIQKPAAPTAPATPQQPPAPFPDGAKVAYFVMQGVIEQSKEGKATADRLKGLQEKRLQELDGKNKALDALKAKASSPSLDDAARAAMQRDIDRQTLDLQRAQEDAQKEVQEQTQEAQNAFFRKVAPIAQQVAKDKGVQMLFWGDQAAIFWAEPGLDLTAEIAKRLDSGPATPVK